MPAVDRDGDIFVLNGRTEAIRERKYDAALRIGYSPNDLNVWAEEGVARRLSISDGAVRR